MGCSVAHDHPGLPSDAWIAVQYADGGRFDLGLYEMILTIPLALCFMWLRRSARPWGFYTALMCVAYAPTRFSLDFLRARDAADDGHWLSAVDPRYATLTPAQWACFGLLLLGFGLLIRLFRAPPSPGPPEVPARFVERPSS
jgi:phosphatidylglycerol:prolipoprotein diacylglycerol transferase